MPVHFRVAVGPSTIIFIAVVLGLSVNALRPDGLPLIRKPLSQTRKVAKSSDLIIAKAPAKVATKSAPSKPIVVPNPNEKANIPPVAPKPAVKPIIPAPSKPVHKQEKPAKPVAAQPKKIQALFTTLSDAYTCFSKKNAIFLDARAIEDYNAEHIAGATWLGYESLDEEYERALGKTPKDHLLITYCSDQQCASATKLADALVERGHTRVVILLEGLPGWRDSGYPTESAKEAGQ